MTILSCDRQNERIKRKYVLENGTDKELKMDFYSNGFYEDTHDIIGPGIVTEGIADDGGMNNFLNPLSAYRTDSVIVIYDNEKQQIYYWDDGYKAIPPTSRNILSNDLYTIENNELYRFTFTEEDYENAEFIED